MRKILFALPFLFVFLCSFIGTPAPGAPLPLKGVGAFAFNESQIIDWTGVQFINDCTGELITLDGQTQVTVHGIFNGKKSSVTWHVNALGVKAIGESGRTYVLSATNNLKENLSFENGLLTARDVVNEHWNTSGRGNNFTIHAAYLFTIDQYGNWTIKRDITDIGCR